MKSVVREAVQNLEQFETGEIRSLLCSACGQRSYASVEQLCRHELDCIRDSSDRADDLKAC
jgi:hypothetical protein